MPAVVRRFEFWIVVAAVLAHGIGVAGVFLYDDLHAVADNEAIRSLGNVGTFFHDPGAFSSTAGRMYRPIVLATLAVSHAIGGGAFWAFAVVDVALHAAVSLLVFGAAKRLGAKPFAAGVAALWFAVHPLNSEAIRLASSRSDQLLAFAVLLVVVVEAGASRSRSGWRGVVAIAVATAIGCGAKETGALIPAIVAATALAAASADGVRARLVGAAARVGASAGVAIGYLVLRKVLLGTATVAAPKLVGAVDVHSGHGRDLLTQFCTMGELLPRLLLQTLVPLGLSLDPPVRYVSDPTAPSVLAGWTALAVLTVVGIRQRGRRPAAFVGAAVAWAIALPWIVIPLNAPLGEHRFYGSLAGLALVVAALVPAGMPRPAWSPPRLAGAVALAVLMLLSIHRGHVLNDPVRAWQSALRLNPESTAAHCCLAQVAEDTAAAAAARGDSGAETAALLVALEHAERAVALRPRLKPARRGVVRHHLWLGPRSPAPLHALVHAEALVDQAANNPFHRLQLGRAFAMAARHLDRPAWFDAGESAALRCLEIAEPKGLVYRVASGIRAEEAEWHAARGDGDAAATARARAVALLDDSIARGLDHWEVRFDRAVRLFEAGRDHEARVELQRVVAANPFNPGARQLLRHGWATPAAAPR